MDQDKKAFNEVRALLGKLDRSIDEARSRRLGPPAQENAGPAANPSTTESNADLDQEIGHSSTNAQQTELQRRGALFGRAKPLTVIPDQSGRPPTTMTISRSDNPDPGIRIFRNYSRYSLIHRSIFDSSTGNGTAPSSSTASWNARTSNRSPNAL